MNRPIYIVTGFLDAGKTSSIKRTLRDPRFTENEKTLILAFEEGDEEFDEAFLEECNCEVEYLDFKDFSYELLAKIDEIHKPDRYFIEFNGMDDDNLLFQMDYPNGLEIAQMMVFVDASTFKLYVNNMPQFMFNHISNSEVCVLHNCEEADFRYLRTNIKSMNQNILILCEDREGNVEPIPLENLFDTNNLDISDDDFGLFYMDVCDNVERYKDKPVKLNGFYFEDKGTSLVFGRLAMVCCANDVQRMAFGVNKLEGYKLKLNAYYQISGTIRLRQEGNGYRIYIDGDSAKEIPAPLNEYVSFS